MPQPLTEEELIGILDAEFDSALGAEGGEIASERARTWDAYLNKPLGNEIEGESQVATSDVSDVVDSIMPVLLRTFTTADNLVSFSPQSAEDIPGAEQESDYVNYVFFQQNPAFLILWTWFFDALSQKNGITMSYWDDSERITTENYRGISIEEVAKLLNDEELEPTGQAERESYVPDPMMPGKLVPVTVYDVKFRRVSKYGGVKVENVPPDEYRISADAHSVDPSSARMVGRERLVPRTELIDMGFDPDIVDGLAAHGDVHLSPERQARHDKTDESFDSSLDRSQDKILVRDGYIKVDADGDGRAELKRLFKAGDKLLIDEDADSQPFHVLCPLPLPHKHFGTCPAEKVLDNREVKTTLLRQTLMNLYKSNNVEHAIWEAAIGENTLDDLLTTRAGSFKRFTRPVQESIMPLTTPFMAQHSFAMLEYMDKITHDRTGVVSDSDAASPERLKHVQQTVMGDELDQAHMKIESIARVFAETGIKSLFMRIHELCLKHQDKAKMVRLRNTFVPVDPRNWRTRMDMHVNIGLGIGTRRQNAMQIEQIFQKQMAMMQAGGANLTVTPKNIYNTAAESVKNANFKTPEMFFTDPGDKLMPPPDSEQTKLKQMEMAIQAREQKLEERRQQLDAIQAQLKQQDMTLKHQRELQEIQRKAEADKDKHAREVEELKNQLLEFGLQNRDPDVERAKKVAEVEKTQAEAMRARAETAKILEETEGQSIENAATESGITEAVENGESDEN